MQYFPGPGVREGSQVRLKAPKADLGACRFFGRFFETGFSKELSKLNIGSAFTFAEICREGRFVGTL